jgi:small subunit ribosomal protein S5
MAEMIEESQALESTTVNLWRNSKVVKGGRRFSLSALVVVGDRRGTVGVGYGKATGAPMAIEKAQKNARKNLVRVSLKDGTLPHQIDGRYSASVVRLIPASPGTGVIAGGTVRAVLEMAGVHDCLTKSYGSNNQKNLVKAAMDGLLNLRTKSDIARLRGVELDETEVEQKLEVGRRYAPSQSSGERAQAPVNVVGQKSGRGGGRRGGGRGGNRGGGNRGGGGGQPYQAPPAAAAAPPAEAAPEQPQASNDAPPAGDAEQKQD